MENYWLSDIDYQKSVIKNIKEGKSKPDPEDDLPEDDTQDEDDPHDRLTDRQGSIYDALEQIASEYGKFDQTAKANGSHYTPSAFNPFKNEGLICGNCVYFKGGQGCELVSGIIEPNAICKFWIIPQELIKLKR
jgi:hypothetical protein